MATESPSRAGRIGAVPLDNFEGADVTQPGDDHAKIRGYFPFSPGTPNASEMAGEDLMVVSFEIEPENYLPEHRDSNEELLVVMAGTVEAWVGDETVELATGECTIVPEMEPHGVRNVGEETAHVLGFFPNDELTATFEKPLEPFGTNVVSIGTGE